MNAEDGDQAHDEVNLAIVSFEEIDSVGFTNRPLSFSGSRLLSLVSERRVMIGYTQALLATSCVGISYKRQHRSYVPKISTQIFHFRTMTRSLHTWSYTPDSPSPLCSVLVSQGILHHDGNSQCETPTRRRDLDKNTFSKSVAFSLAT